MKNSVVCYVLDTRPNLIDLSEVLASRIVQLCAGQTLLESSIVTI